jgi:hypothetical protein
MNEKMLTVGALIVAMFALLLSGMALFQITSNAKVIERIVKELYETEKEKAEAIRHTVITDRKKFRLFKRRQNHEKVV